VRLEHLEVCADPVAGAEDNQVAAHEFDRINGAEGSVTPHPGECRKQGGETLGRPVGAVVLREREDRVEHDHHDDGNGERGHTGDDRQPARDPQQHGEQVGELAREGANRRASGQGGALGPSIARRCSASPDVSPCMPRSLAADWPRGE
jgi:hypothetical protein